jgi:hypothetical protein
MSQATPEMIIFVLIYNCEDQRLSTAMLAGGQGSRALMSASKILFRQPNL